MLQSWIQEPIEIEQGRSILFDDDSFGMGTISLSDESTTRETYLKENTPVFEHTYSCSIEIYLMPNDRENSDDTTIVTIEHEDILLSQEPQELEEGLYAHFFDNNSITYAQCKGFSDIMLEVRVNADCSYDIQVIDDL